MKKEKIRLWREKLVDLEFQCDIYMINRFVGLPKEDDCYRDQAWLDRFDNKYIVPMLKSQKLLGIESDFISNFYEEVRGHQSYNTPENIKELRKTYKEYKLNQLEKITMFSKNASFILRNDRYFNDYYKLIKMSKETDQEKVLALSILIQYVVTRWLIDNGFDKTEKNFEGARLQFEDEAIANAKQLLGVKI